MDSSDSRYGPLADCYEYGNEPSNFIKGGKFLDNLSDH